MREIEDEPGLHQCYAVSGDARYDHSLFMGPSYGFDSMLFRLGIGLAKLSTVHASPKKPKASEAE